MMEEHRKYRPVGRGEATLNPGFWSSRIGEYMKIIRNMEEILLDRNNAARLLNFAIAAGEMEGEFFKNDWSDGDCYKFLEGCLNQYALTKDREILAIVDKYIPWIQASQEEDGYICTQISLTGRKRWEHPSHHELYNFGHLFTAASVHYEVTGDQRLLDVAKRAADQLWEVFSPLPPELGDFGFNPSQIMGLVELYRLCGDERYLKLGEVFVTMRGSKVGTGDQNQCRVPLREEHMPVGHAVTAAYLYAGAADVYAHTGEKALMDALERIWREMISRRIYITGGVCPVYVGVSERGDNIHEAFGDEYNLPHRISYNESCANIAVAMWAHRMYLLKGDSSYGDWMETILFNAGISGASLDMMRFFYVNPLAHRAEEHLKPTHTQYAHAPNQRFSTFNCWCCPPQLWRTFTSIPRWVYSLGEEGVSIDLFAACRLESRLANGAPVTIDMKSDYPWDGTVNIEILEAPEGGMDLAFRIPSWCSSASYNGAPIQGGVHHRRVEAGEKISILLAMEARLYRANPMVEQANGMLAVKRGPVVYCLEGCDIEAGFSIDELALPTDAQFREERIEDLPYGMVALWTELIHRPRGTELYSPLAGDGEKRVKARFIPYFSWANREESDMSVWLARA